MKYWKNKSVHFLIFGGAYMNFEVFARAYVGALIGYNGISEWSLCGWTSIWMFLLGGFCGVIIGLLNDRPQYYKLKMWQQVIIGGSLISWVELLAGIILNIYLHLNLWDYSYSKYNFLNQICLENCILWYLMSVVIIWLDDVLSHYFYGEEKPGSLFSYFKQIIKFK